MIVALYFWCLSQNAFLLTLFNSFNSPDFPDVCSINYITIKTNAMSSKQTITVEATVNAPAKKVWDYWTQPEHITQWNAASEEWHSPSATNDLRSGGAFVFRMEAKDGSFGFDFGGTYSSVKPLEYIEYEIEDGRKVEITFTAKGNTTTVTETFDPESQNPLEMQQAGWQAILNNFKAYTENN